MAQRFACEIVTWSDFERLSRKLALQIQESGFEPDMLVAIGRGGYMPARMLSDFLDLMDLASVRIVHYHGAHKDSKARVRYPLSANPGQRRVLLVDDVSDSGDTFDAAMDHLMTRGHPAEIRTAVLHHKTTARFLPDFYAHKITKWRWLIYPWAITEDIGTFVREMDPMPETLEAVATRLKLDHGLQLPRRQLAHVLAMIKHPAAL